MKKIYIILIVLFLPTLSCIRIESNPLVTVDPTVHFQGHIRNENVYVTATIYANPAFIDPGNIPTVFIYEGELDLYSEASGELISSVVIEGDGLASVNKLIASAEDFDKMIIIATGKVSVYADKGEDGKAANDLFIHSSSFYEVMHLTEVINVEDYPVVTLRPEVDFQMYISNSILYTTATITANPNYIITGSVPIVFEYDGVMQLYDEDSGMLLKSSSLTGDGLSNATTILADTSSFNGFIIIASGKISASADIGSDGNPINDLFISSAEYKEIQLVDLVED